MTFTEKYHSYIDNKNRKYTSVTSLVKSAFEPFDAEKAAKMKAARTGEDPQQLIKEWAELGKVAANSGTRSHEYAEYLIKENIEIHIAENPEELIKFNAIKTFIQNFKEKFPIESIETEKLVFSSHLLIAGSIDLLIKLKTGQYIIRRLEIFKKRFR